MRDPPSRRNASILSSTQSLSKSSVPLDESRQRSPTSVRRLLGETRAGRRALERQPNALLAVDKDGDVHGDVHSTSASSSAGREESDFVSGIRIVPSKVEFTDIHVGERYATTIYVQNTGLKPLRFRAFRPATAAFSMHFESTSGIAPGMELPLHIEFTCTEDVDVFDRVIIQTDHGNVEVPLRALLPSPFFEFESFVNFGVVIPEQICRHQLSVKNTGKREGSISFLYSEDLSISVQPKMLLLQAGESGSVMIELVASEPGIIRGVCQVDISGCPSRLIDISASVVLSQLQVVRLDKTLIRDVTFPITYFGAESIEEFILVNNSPNASSFAIFNSAEMEGQSEIASSEASENHRDPASVFRFEPSEGHLLPYQELRVRAIFQPKQGNPKRGFRTTEHSNAETPISSTFVVDALECEQKLEYPIRGSAIVARVSMSNDSFRFGDSSCNERKDMLFTIKNECDRLPVQFHFTSMPHFHLKPSEGALNPLESKNIVLTFLPKQLGRFGGTMFLELVNGSVRVPLRVSGIASHVGVRRQILSGIDKLPEDFTQKPHFVPYSNGTPFIRPSSSSTLSNTQRVELPSQKGRTQAVSVTSRTLTIDNYPPEILEEYETRRNRLRSYNEYIRQGKSQEDRENERLRHEYEMYMNDVDLGMIPASGLESPRLDTKLNEYPPLYLEKPIPGVFASSSMLENEESRKKSHIFDENKIIKKKFKGEPKTPMEMRDCHTELSPKQLLNVVIGPKVIDFGRVSLFSHNVKTFYVANDLNQFIWTQFSFEEGREELRQSYPASQVIPAGAQAAFDIHLYSESLQSFQHSVFFTINEKHTMKFMVYAEIIPIDVRFSRDEIFFSFNDSSLDPFVTESVILTNHSNSVAHWSFAELDPECVFSVDVVSGALEPGENCSIAITFRPNSITEADEVLLLRVKGGPEKELRCFARIPEVECSFSEKKIDLGSVAVGIEIERRVTLRNTGDNPVMYWIDPPLPGITVSPMRGRIPMESSQVLSVHLNPPMPQLYDDFLVVNLRGGRPVRLPLRAEALIPQIEFDRSDIVYSDVHVGSAGKKLLEIANQSPFASTLMLDFEHFMDFTLVDKDGEPISEDSTGPIAKLHRETGPVGLAEEDEDEDEDEDDLDVLSDDDSQIDLCGPLYKIIIPPRKSIFAYLVYQPQEEGELDFELPISIAGIPSSIISLHRRVRATAQKARISLSVSEVNFFNRVILKENDLPYRLEVEITNEDQQALTWELGSFQGDDAHLFESEPSSGNLMPGETGTLWFIFKPNDFRAFSCSVPLFLNGEYDRAYMEIPLKGFGIHPMLMFDCQEVVLPPVPLSIRSELTFLLINEGYDQLEVKYRLPADKARIPLELEFPEGCMVSRAKKQIPVKVSFIADHPLTFTGKVDFFDAHGNRFSLTVSGTTDNSLMTNFPFLAMNKSSYRVVLDSSSGNSVRCSKKEEELESGFDDESDTISTKMSMYSGFASEAMSSVYAQSERQRRKVFSKPSMTRLKNWLNMNALRTPIDDILIDMGRTHGSAAFEAIQALSGMKVDGFIGNSLVESKSEATMQLYEQYLSLLRFVKSYGGFLNHISPEYLLRYDDYCRYMSMKQQREVENQTAPSPYQMKRMTERRFIFRSAEAWSTLFYQAIRVFVLERITPKMMKTVPGVVENSGIIDSSITKSNLYSVSESILLRWCAFHYNRIFPPSDLSEILSTENANASTSSVSDVNLKSTKKGRNDAPNPTTIRLLRTFDRDFRNSRVYAALLISHAPQLERIFHRGRLYEDCTSSDQFQHNARLVFEAMAEIGLSCAWNESDLYKSTSRDAVLFISYLFQMLPQYLPKAEILFEGPLHASSLKTIELSNPSPAPIEYEAVLLQNEKIFFVGERRLRIPAKSSLGCIVTNIPRFLRESRATLSFVPRRIGQAVGATLVFTLVSRPSPDIPMKTFHVSSKLYESTPVEILVENVFPSAAKFDVRMTQEAVSAMDTKNRKRWKSTSQEISGKKKESSGSINGKIQSSSTSLNSKNIEDSNKTSKSDQVNAVSASALLFPDAFWMKVSRLNIKASDRSVLNLQFLPFQMGSFRCRIFFLDSNLGEFFYDLIGESELPSPVPLTAEGRLRIISDFGSRSESEISVPLVNDRIVQGLGLVQERYKELKLKRKPTPIPPLDVPEICYSVEFDSPYYTAVPNEVVLSNPSLENDVPGSSSASSSQRESQKMKSSSALGSRKSSPAATAPVRVTFSPSSAGIYPTRMIMRSMYDVRVFELEGKCNPPGVSSTLEFSIPCRQSIVQDIPLTNHTNSSFVVKATLSGSKLFSGPSEIRVDPGETKNYHLVFRPPWICEADAELVLENASSGEKYKYMLKGIGEDPLPEDHVSVTCEARSQVEVTLKIPNVADGNVQYEVETDLPFVLGDAELQIRSGGSAVYSFSVAPPMAGNFTGTISFVCPDTSRYVWYTLRIEASPPPSEGLVHLNAQVRCASAAEISVSNPLPHPVQFDVRFEGDGLLGDPHLTLGPMETAVYELIFSPLHPGSSKGKLFFFNQSVGEFWYELLLEASPSSAITLPEFVCPIGCTKSFEYNLENPLGEAVVLNVVNNNSRNYSVSPSSLHFGPYEVMTVTFTYSPSSLRKDEIAEITLTNAKIGEYLFLLRGSATPPTIMDVISVTSPVGHSSSQMISFKNPFSSAFVYAMHLESDEDSSVFQLLSRRQRMNIAAFATVQIPFSFRPQRMTEHRATLHLETVVDGDELVWKFPIRGSAESAPPVGPFRFDCKSRTRLEETLEIFLPELELGKRERFRVETHVQVEEDRALVGRALTANLLNAEVQGPEDPLLLSIVFMPLRPLSSFVDLFLYKESGGVWKYEIQLEASPPDMDDVITIECGLNKTESVTFRLNNVFAQPASFRAFYTPDSPLDFAVNPSEGVLSPYNGEGTQFVVSFHASSYGKPPVGCLVIETDEMQWRYEVRGALPEYRVPEGRTIKSRIETRLAPDVAAALRRSTSRGEGVASLQEPSSSRSTRPRNYLQQNMLSLKHNGNSTQPSRKSDSSSRSSSRTSRTTSASTSRVILNSPERSARRDYSAR